jgi:hypothetical protein
MTVFFTPYYGDIILNLARKLNLTESSVIGHKLSLRCLNYLQEHRLPVDLKGRSNDYDLLGPDHPQQHPQTQIVLVQEGMTDPENFAYHLVKWIPILPRWLASTSTTGLVTHITHFAWQAKVTETSSLEEASRRRRSQLAAFQTPTTSRGSLRTTSRLQASCLYLPRTLARRSNATIVTRSS